MWLQLMVGTNALYTQKNNNNVAWHNNNEFKRNNEKLRGKYSFYIQEKKKSVVERLQCHCGGNEFPWEEGILPEIAQKDGHLFVKKSCMLCYPIVTRDGRKKEGEKILKCMLAFCVSKQASTFFPFFLCIILFI